MIKEFNLGDKVKFSEAAANLMGKKVCFIVSKIEINNHVKFLYDSNGHGYNEILLEKI